MKTTEQTWFFRVRKTPYKSTLTLLLQAACQGLQGPNIPDYSADFFIKSKVINHVTYLVQCVKELGKN